MADISIIVSDWLIYKQMFSSETTVPVGTKLWRNGVWKALYNNNHPFVAKTWPPIRQLLFLIVTFNKYIELPLFNNLKIIRYDKKKHLSSCISDWKWGLTSAFWLK
jgi:hypothetical protein